MEGKSADVHGGFQLEGGEGRNVIMGRTMEKTKEERKEDDGRKEID
jgi:hypothetical protein